jgi:hypothetical protein
VNGTATLEVSPDCADLTMTLSADGARPGVATKSVQAKERDLVAALGKLGVEAADLKLSYLTLNPIYDPNPSGWAQLSIHTYRAEITVTATTHKFDQIGAIMEAGAEAGSSSMSSQFRRSDLAELKKQVREMALTAAKAKAQQTATALGIKLGRIVSVGENVNGSMWGVLPAGRERDAHRECRHHARWDAATADARHHDRLRARARGVIPLHPPYTRGCHNEPCASWWSRTRRACARALSICSPAMVMS